ncbi:cell division protein ZapA [Litorimonas haliclonae]|uniref:cell division protein ZapA n=1 Tax=Litorimonas haliclonae TaxID=2081977 RepID=UPI0039EF29BE
MTGRVSININGRKYGLGCEEGEQERLVRLGQKLDDRVNAMANQFGQIGDLRLLVMAGITLLDEIEDVGTSVEDRVETRIGEIKKEHTQAIQAVEQTEAQAASSLRDAALRIERLAEKIASTTSQ